MIYIAIIIIFLSLYIMWRNFAVYNYRTWFNNKCYEYSIKQIKDNTWEKPINRDEIVGEYFHLLLSFRSFDKMILDKEKYNKIVGEK